MILAVQSAEVLVTILRFVDTGGEERQPSPLQAQAGSIIKGTEKFG